MIIFLFCYFKHSLCSYVNTNASAASHSSLVCLHKLYKAGDLEQLYFIYLLKEELQLLNLFYSLAIIMLQYLLLLLPFSGGILFAYSNTNVTQYSKLLHAYIHESIASLCVSKQVGCIVRHQYTKQCTFIFMTYHAFASTKSYYSSLLGNEWLLNILQFLIKKCVSAYMEHKTYAQAYNHKCLIMNFECHQFVYFINRVLCNCLYIRIKVETRT